MKRSLIILALAAVAQTAAAADLKKGEQLAQQQCAACHGKDFVSPVDPTYPKLAGQYVDYLEKALRDYQTGARKNPIMAGLAKPLSRDDIRNVSAYMASLPGPLNNAKR
jgi:cytochrome c553